VPRHLESFEAGVEEAMRRKPEAGLVGECKDVETVTTCLDMASTGHQVVTTTHATDVPQTIRRMVTFFPREERESRCLQMAESLRMIVVQILVPTLDGKRRACREILVFDAIMRERLMETPIEQWPLEVKSMVRQKGQPMIDPIVNLWREKLISPLIWQQYERQA